MCVREPVSLTEHPRDFGTADLLGKLLYENIVTVKIIVNILFISGMCHPGKAVASHHLVILKRNFYCASFLHLIVTGFFLISS